ncbi:hypothetical protein N181_02970 [Sinorhizobium fredii USDA 205]|nr:hypothetical protein N181_02970 [Sinorhizobium fredii USDA 205]GEC33351.1 hypothetical protein EFR01_35220 [Sinorhizobium fredii]GLS07653.1 hypothetical protein GCM10007864_12800 [Sinorhizobium fredii]
MGKAENTRARGGREVSEGGPTDYCAGAGVAGAGVAGAGVAGSGVAGAGVAGAGVAGAGSGAAGAGAGSAGAGAGGVSAVCSVPPGIRKITARMTIATTMIPMITFLFIE